MKANPFFLSLYLQPSALPHRYPVGTSTSTCPKINSILHLLSLGLLSLSQLETGSYLQISHLQTFSHAAQVSYLTHRV